MGKGEGRLITGGAAVETEERRVLHSADRSWPTSTPSTDLPGGDLRTGARRDQGAGLRPRHGTGQRHRVRPHRLGLHEDRDKMASGRRRIPRRQPVLQPEVDRRHGGRHIRSAASTCPARTRRPAVPTTCCSSCRRSRSGRLCGRAGVLARARPPGRAPAQPSWYATRRPTGGRPRTGTSALHQRGGSDRGAVAALQLQRQAHKDELARQGGEVRERLDQNGPGTQQNVVDVIAVFGR